MTSTTPFPLGAYIGQPNNASAADEAAFTAEYNSFTGLMGAAPQFLNYYIDQSQPVSQWVGNAQWAATSAAASPAKSAAPVIALPLTSTASALTADQQYQAFASGQYDSTIQGAVQVWAQQGFTTQYWRPGWEMNIPSMPSYAGTDAQTQADWVRAFQHVSAVLHQAGTADGVNVQVVWNPTATNYDPLGVLQNLYPGNASVDIIGADAYADMYPYSPLYDWDKNNGTVDSSLAQFIADPVNRLHYWNYPAATPYSLDGSDGHNLDLQTLLAFAKAQGKPLAVPETGAGNAAGGHDVADDPQWAQWLAQTLQASGDKISFVNLWDSNGGGNFEFSSSAAGKPQAGTLEISARHAGGSVVIEVRDDGHGINPQAVARKALERGLIDAQQAQEMGRMAAARLESRMTGIETGPPVFQRVPARLHFVPTALPASAVKESKA